MRYLGLLGVLVGAWLGAGAWAQPGPGHGPRGSGAEAQRSAEREPRVHRDELRAFIRQQPAPQWEEEPPAGQRQQRQLSPEERQNLRNQLRQQRGEDWRRPP